MSTKYVMLLFYDIPMKTKLQRKRYNKFRDYILSINFVMIQESMYIRNISSKEMYHRLTRDFKLSSPSGSNIRSILLTQRDYLNIELICGEQTFNEKIINKQTRVIEI